MAPSGVAECTPCRKPDTGAASAGLEYQPADAHRDSQNFECSPRRSASRRRSWRRPGRNGSRCRGSADAAHLRSVTSNTSSISRRAARASLAADGAAYWFSTVRPASSMHDAAVNPFQQIQRLETGHHDRHAEPPASGSYSSNPITVQTWPAARNPCTRLRGDERMAPSPAAPARATRARRSSSAPAFRLRHGHRVGRRRGLESDGEKNDRAIRVLLGDLQAVQRRIDDAHVATLPPLTANRSRRLPGTRSMSPKEQKITSGRAAISIGLVDQFQRRDADRAAGTVHQFDLRGSSSSMPYLTIVWVWPPQISMIVQGRVVTRWIAYLSFCAAAPSRYSSWNFMMPAPERSLHFAATSPVAARRKKVFSPRPGLGGRSADRMPARTPLQDSFVFFYPLAGSPAFNSSNSFIFRRKEKTCWASSSSTTERAKPTWTSTYLPTFDFRHVIEAYSLRHAAEIDLSHKHVVFPIGLHDFSRYCKAHAPTSFQGGRIEKMAPSSKSILGRRIYHRQACKKEKTVA